VALIAARKQPMARPYYSSRKQPLNLTLNDLYSKLYTLYQLFRSQDYFREKAGITEVELPQQIQHEASLALTFQPFPIESWWQGDITEDRVFDTLEFLFDYVSEPIAWSHFDQPIKYDEESGRANFRSRVNAFLLDYKPGYELNEQGIIKMAGRDGLQHILNADIVPYDEQNVDSKVRDAIDTWRNRHSTLKDKREAIRELADVFEWLKKSKELSSVLDAKDESAIFELANNFGIRHHNPKQKTNYDETIWFSWIFHFYLATYHAAIRLLIKREKSKKKPA